jgi:hypothetical protein
MKDDEICWSYSMYEVDEKCIHILVGKPVDTTVDTKA